MNDQTDIEFFKKEIVKIRKGIGAIGIWVVILGILSIVLK